MNRLIWFVPLTLLLLWGGGCSSVGEDVVFLREGVPTGSTFKTILQGHPLRSEDNFKNTEFLRTDEMSHHLVQIRDREKLHVHRHHDMMAYLYQGWGTFKIGEKLVPLKPGDFVMVPKGTPHQFVNESQDVAVAYAVISPPFDKTDVHILE